MNRLCQKLTRYLSSMLATAIGLILLASNSYAYELPPETRGSCPYGYRNVLTTPANFRAEDDAVSLYWLPSNVCVRRYFGGDGVGNRLNGNFTREDIAVLVYSASGEASFDLPAPIVIDNYEPLLGHFIYDYGLEDVLSSGNEHFQNFAGAHPFFIRKSAYAAIKYVNGLYLIDKQSLIFQGNAICPKGYSTVGNSITCYSRHNALKLNDYKKVELVEMPPYHRDTRIGQRCPLGFSIASNLGSDGGLCTQNEVVFQQTSRYGIPLADFRGCPQGEYSPGGACVPSLTIMYCAMDGEAMALFDYPYRGGRHAIIWPTTLAGSGNTGYDKSFFYDSTTFGSVSTNALRLYDQFFADDEQFFRISGFSIKERWPAIHVYTGLSCAEFYDNGGWSIEPVPPSW